MGSLAAQRMEAGDYVIDEENAGGVVFPGFPAAMHAVVIYRVHDGQIREVVMLR